ncbi:UDP-glucuronosyltransferase 1-9 [Temnothorax longispinosus]|uniref:UDP-glucuronosyltransferase 1-9 n=1 Tax=Temnothorax longispinosus TaxID=300112 RepID=A0A4S2L1J2_9HYME|nr:UDP-glucuronosyltransferase 1-9 [Temnothorax longispinosus]
MLSSVVLFVCCILTGDLVTASKPMSILVIATLPSPSHHVWTEHLVKGLLRKGHHVFDGVMETIEQSEDYNLAEWEQYSVLYMIKFQYQWGIGGCQTVIRTKGARELLEMVKTVEFDVIVHDITLAQCFYGLWEVGQSIVLAKPLHEIEKDRINIVLINTHPALEPAIPLPPNTLEIAGLNAQAIEPIAGEIVTTYPEDVRVFLDGAKNGAIVISLGTNVKWKMIGLDKVETVILALSKLKQRVLWKLDIEVPFKIPNNVMIVKWMPQSLLIKIWTHGGLLSTQENIWKGVPMIVMPFFLDQKFNTEILVAKGVGIYLDIQILSTQSILHAVEEIVYNESYTKNMKQLSTEFRDRPIPPLDLAVWSIEYTVRHPNLTLATPLKFQSWVERNQIDVYALLLLIFFTIFFFVCCILMGDLVTASKPMSILVIETIPSTSHHVWTEHLVKGLLRKGHHVFDGVMQTYEQSEDYNPAEWEQYSVLYMVNFMYQWGMSGCQTVIRTKAARELLEMAKTVEFDVIVQDITITQCFYGFYPTVRPYPASIVKPDSLWLRAWNALYYIVDDLIRDYYYLPIIQQLTEEYLGHAIRPLHEIEKDRINIVLINTHPALEPAIPLPPNTLEIAGLNAQAIEPIAGEVVATYPEDVRVFLDGAKNGAVVISLGTNVKWKTIGLDKVETVILALSKLKQRVLWKLDIEVPFKIPDNVMIVKWIPQSLRAVWTHGGLLSTQENIWKGIPMIVMPFFMDQKFNTEILVAKGVGIYLDIKILSTQSILHAVEEILYNESYTKNMKQLSREFRDRPLPPLDLAVWGIEYTVRHPNLTLATPLKFQSWVERNQIDVYAFLLLIFFAILLNIFFVIKLSINFFYNHIYTKLRKSKQAVLFNDTVVLLRTTAIVYVSKAACVILLRINCSSTMPPYVQIIIFTFEQSAALSVNFGCTKFPKVGGDFKPIALVARLAASSTINPKFAVGFWNAFCSSFKFSAGILTSSKKIAAVLLHLMPIFFSGGPLVTPPNPLSTMKAVTLSFVSPVFGSLIGICANTVMTSAMPPLDIQILLPLRT